MDCVENHMGVSAAASIEIEAAAHLFHSRQGFASPVE
jgi:hypothetical protein